MFDAEFGGGGSGGKGFVVEEGEDSFLGEEDLDDFVSFLLGEVSVFLEFVGGFLAFGVVNCFVF